MTPDTKAALAVAIALGLLVMIFGAIEHKTCETEKEVGIHFTC